MQYGDASLIDRCGPPRLPGRERVNTKLQATSHHTVSIHAKLSPFKSLLLCLVITTIQFRPPEIPCSRERRKLISTRYQSHMSWTVRRYYRAIIYLLTAVEDGGKRVKVPHRPTVRGTCSKRHSGHFRQQRQTALSAIRAYGTPQFGNLSVRGVTIE